MHGRIYSVVLYVLLCGSVLQRGGQAVKSAHACERQELSLRCPSPTVLLIYRAMFGRNEPGSSICPHANISKTSCEARGALKIVTSLCTHKDKCDISADSSVFGGDPCPGTFKYLDVIYACVVGPVSTTITNPRSATTKTNITNSTTTITTISTNYTSRPGSTKPSPRARGEQPDATVIPTSTTATAPQGAPKMGFSGPTGEQSITVSLLVSFVLCYKVVKEKPRYTIVIFLSVVAAVTIALLVLLTAVHICKRQNEKRNFQVEMQESQKDEQTPRPKTVTIEIQGSREDTREIHVSPGDIIIIDHNGLNSAGSEDLGYLSEIVRYYNGQSTTGSDDQSSIRKRSLTCGTPSLISTETSEIDKKADGKTDPPEVNGDCVRRPPIDITVNPLCVS